MRSVGVRELKQNASAVIAEVAAGETVIVTDRRRPVAQLVPITSDWLATRIAVGIVRPRKRSLASLGAAIKPARGSASLSSILGEMRDDERT
jgi:prevent-host-death family protein